MQKKLMMGLSQFAVLEDVNDAGYLGMEEIASAQRARVDLGAYCEGLAEQYLRRSQSPGAAKQALRADIRTIEVNTDSGKFTDDEAELFDRFVSRLDETIDSVATMNASRRFLIRWIFRTPGFVIALIVAAILTGTVIVLGKIFQ